jgi:hypothetical protein
MTVGAVFQQMVTGDQHGIWPELHFIFDDDSAPSVNPATCSDVDIAADFQAIREVNCDPSRDLEIRSTGFEARTEEKSSHAHERPEIRQPACCNGHHVEPEIFEQAHTIGRFSCGLQVADAPKPARLGGTARRARTRFLWNSRRVLRQVPVELFQDYRDESFEGVRAGGDESVPDQCAPQVTIANDSFDR